MSLGCTKLCTTKGCPLVVTLFHEDLKRIFCNAACDAISNEPSKERLPEEVSIAPESKARSHAGRYILLTSISHWVHSSKGMKIRMPLQCF
eukprot:3296540-Ditylum_brightwellii.AAC.1